MTNEFEFKISRPSSHWGPEIHELVCKIKASYTVTYGTRQKKMTLTFRTFFQNTFVVQPAPQIRWLLPQIRRLLRIARFPPKTQKASSEECWVCTHITFQNTVQLRSWIFQSCVCVFWVAFVTAKQNSNGKVSPQIWFHYGHGFTKYTKP